MLVLCSNGLSSNKILAYMKKKVVSCKTAALVVTADNEYKENNYHVARCIKELESLDLKVDIFDLDKQPATLLSHYDRFLSKFEKFEEKCFDYEKEHNVNFIRINDGEGVFIDEEVYVCKES